MKTREQLIEEIGWISDHLIATGHPEEIIDLIVSACEEMIPKAKPAAFLDEVGRNEVIEEILQNLKKLKSK